MRLRLMIAMMAVAAGVGACAQVSGPRSVAEQYLFAAANAERAQRGLQPLRWDAALYRAAAAHAEEMAARGSISHQYPGELELAARGRRAAARFSLIEENVAMSPNAVRMHAAWMESAGHRANLLEPQVDAVGIGVVSRRGELYAVEDFSRSVRELTVDEQEGVVVGELQGVGVVGASEAARQTCAMESGYAGERQPGFVMRYTVADLGRLPGALRTQLQTGRYREAAVGACGAAKEENFATYSIAVMLFP